MPKMPGECLASSEDGKDVDGRCFHIQLDVCASGPPAP